LGVGLFLSCLGGLLPRLRQDILDLALYLLAPFAELLVLVGDNLLVAFGARFLDFLFSIAHDFVGLFPVRQYKTVVSLLSLSDFLNCLHELWVFGSFKNNLTPKQAKLNIKKKYLKTRANVFPLPFSSPINHSARMRFSDFERDKMGAYKYITQTLQKQYKE